MASSTQSHRPYDLVLLGATGYTGAYTIPHICSDLFPADLPWAIAGRNESKLKQVVADIVKKYPNRKAPGVEVCQHEANALQELASKTRTLITTVGPFSNYGEVVVKACAQAGTSYIDCTGEVPWVKRMVDRYDKLAKENGAIIVPQAGIESAISDLLAYALATEIRKTYDLPVKEVDNLVWNMKSAPSGGTLATVFNLFEAIPISEINASMQPYALSPVPRPRGTYPARGGMGLFTGMKWIEKLGWGVNSGPIMGVTNAAIVWRTWGLFQQAAAEASESQARQTRISTSLSNGLSYGPNWHYTEMRRVNGRIKGILANLAITILPVFMLLSPLRWLLKKMVFKPGQGPTVESTKNDEIEFRAVATADSTGESKKMVTGHALWKGSMYDLTGLTLAAGASVMLQLCKEREGQVEKGQEECYARRHEGGVMTPACLGQSYVDGVKKGGLILEMQT